MKFVLAMLLAAGFTPSVQAATDRDGWTCAASQCVEAKTYTFASFSGTFNHATGLDSITDADRIAALEQQSIREFEFTMTDRAMVAAEVKLDLGYLPQSDTPEPLVDVLTWISQDGESYTRLADGDVLDAGDLLLVAVRQARVEADGKASYYPARWTLKLTQQRVRPDADWDGEDGPVLLPTQMSADGDPEPQEKTSDTNVPTVAGSSGLTAPVACSGGGCGSDTPPATLSKNDLAAELQRELARVGCYRSPVDGLWGPGSRRAVADFNAQSGTTLDPTAPSPATRVAIAREQETVCKGE